MKIVRNILLWVGLLAASFAIGALVVSPILNKVTGFSDQNSSASSASVSTNAPVQQTQSTPAPAPMPATKTETIPLTQRDRVNVEAPDINVTPDNSGSSDIQSSQSPDSSTSGDSSAPAVIKPTRHHRRKRHTAPTSNTESPVNVQPAPAPPVQPGDNIDQ